MSNVSAYRLAKGEALEDVLHYLLLSLHGDYTWKHELEVHTMALAYLFI